MRLARKTTLLAVAAGLAAAGAAFPSGVAQAGGGGGGVTPPSGAASGSPSYSVTVQGSVDITGNVHGGGGVSEYYQPPNCWIQPWFNQPQSWVQGDPQTVGDPRSASDADTFWWDMADKYPGLLGLIAHVPDARQSINQDFQTVQQGTNDSGGGAVSANWVWWAPNWLNNSQGFACAQGLVSSIGMNNGFLDLEPPQPPDNGAPGQITSEQLAGLARAALRLPTVAIHTSPKGSANATAFVNSPTSMWLTYNPVESPKDDAKVIYIGGTYLEARITTSVPTIAITTNDQGAAINNNGTCLANSKCSVTFNGPTTTGNPYTITVTATWTVTWQTSAGKAGTFTQPPSVVTATHTVVVREIQSVN